MHNLRKLGTRKVFLCYPQTAAMYVYNKLPVNGKQIFLLRLALYYFVPVDLRDITELASSLP